MSNVLLVDTNLASWPLYTALVGMGHEVYVVGGNPQDYLATSTPHYINLNYADFDAMCALINRLKIEYLVPGCNDFSYAVCARLSETFGFHGIDSIANSEIINNKQKFRHFALNNAIPVPALIPLEYAPEMLPVIVKPVDSYSGRGITVVQAGDASVLAQAIAAATSESRSGEYVVEQYVTGQLYSHSALIVDHSIVLDFMVQEQCVASPFAVDTSRLASSLSAAVTATVRAAITRMASLLGLKDGLVHTQFIMRDEQVWIIEVTRRCPGDLYSLLIEYSSGYHYAEMYVRPFLGLPLDIRGQPTTRHIVRHTMTVPQQTRFTAVSFRRSVALAGYFSLARCGDLIAPAPLGRMGIFFTESASAEQQQSIYDDLAGRTLYVIR